jgi:Uma2 family endonuclease
MRILGEIVLPETKPETEWIDGRAVQKVMPNREHGIMQLAFADALKAWAKAGKRGQVATEWRFRVDASLNEDDQIHPLVPDVAFMSFARLRSLPKDKRRYPIIAPEIVVEILSPGYKPAEVETKRKEYLAWGVWLVLIINYEKRSAEAYDSAGGYTKIGADENYSPTMFSDLQFPMRELFAELDIPEE